ncbi:S-adenosyl-L-methionine-dependent methyltransferase [Podospora appendiculata]|uniref:S-adenosyl-L-methionine-dependent methyltransferase n=1 Tax=Podospora appendiculata TaxID=314037 RepID=A0AAE1CHP6_9PEZI|nr:S-adenosyl-L-methionine-dependent methyltransferase [Podospora appendiculata]
MSGSKTGNILPPEHWVKQAEDDADDQGSVLSDDNVSSTTSLSSSILDYRTIHGRTFHQERGNAEYWGSNDAKQNESLDIHHHACTLALDGKLYLAPLVKSDIKHALDIGTGTGIWAIDFADEFPGAEVIGTDISPIQPSWLPPNLRFEIEDCTLDWTFGSGRCDYIHMRWLLGSIVDWNELFQRAFDTLKPGGWFESYEMSAIIESDDGTVHDETALAQWGKIFIEGGRKNGRSFTILQDETQTTAMQQAGFVDIQEKNFKMPIGAWPLDPKKKEMGRFAQLTIEQDPEGYTLFMADALGWSREQILDYIASLKKEVRSGKYHPYYKQKSVWGRKPENA